MFYKLFIDWCRDRGEREKAACAFGRTLGAYGVQRTRKRQEDDTRPYIYDLSGARVERDPAAAAGEASDHNYE